MNKKPAKLILFGITSGLFAGIIVPVIDFMYMEATIKDSVIAQYNGFVLLSSIAYVPIGIIFGIIAAFILSGRKLTSLNLFLLLTLLTTGFVSLTYLFLNFI